MTAILVLPGTAPEADWHAARREGVTASEIAVLMGLSPYSSPFALYHQKLGLLGAQPDSMAMALGRHLESFVADQFAARRPDLTVTGDGRGLYSRPDRPWQMATPDRLILLGRPAAGLAGCIYPEAVLECKTAGSYDGWGDDGTSDIPVHYRCQVLWQMDVLSVRNAFVACLFLHSRSLRVYEVAHASERTHDWLGAEGCAACTDLAVMRAEAGAFLARVRDQRPPEVDWRPATADALKRLHPHLEDRDVQVSDQLAGWYRAACRNLTAAEQRKKLYENRLRDLLGSGRRVLTRDGRPVATRQVYDVKEHVRKASTTDKIVPARTKKES